MNTIAMANVCVIIALSLRLNSHPFFSYTNFSRLVKGYKLYMSDSAENYLSTKAYDIPDVVPGKSVRVLVDDLYKGGGIVTVVRPNGYIVSQKNFYNLYE